MAGVLLSGTAADAQTKAKPKGKAPVRKSKKPIVRNTNKPGTSPFSLSVIKDDVTLSYDLKKGDKLVYHVTNNGNEYDFTVTINTFSYDKGIDFSYEIGAPVNKKGHVNISGPAYRTSRKYVNYFAGGELKLTDACAIWLCHDAYYEDLNSKKTVMTMDNGAPETFYEPEDDAVEHEIIFKGETVKVDALRLNNKSDGNGSKEVWVHNSSGNPLIIKMDVGYTIELKEVK